MVIEDGPVLAVQFIRYVRRFGVGYWFAPRGPVVTEHAMEHLPELMKFLCTSLRDQCHWSRSSLFLRVEPVLHAQLVQGALPLDLRRTHSMSPSATMRLNLQQTEEELLTAMHPKTRYNIRVAERHGVTVRESVTTEDVDHFLRLTQETAQRDGIHTHTDSYLRATIDTLSKQGMARLRLAEHGGQVLAANIEITYGDTATYLHGASSSSSRNVMAPILLQWEAIKQARTSGYRWYDFYGVNPVSKTNFYYKPSWEGITRFKQGFGGEQIELMGTWDLPLHGLLYKLVMPKTF